MKLKVTKRTSTQVDTDLDLPIYLSFQDEFGYYEYVKIDEGVKITIKEERYTNTITVSTLFHVDEWEVQERNLTTKEDFDEYYQSTVNWLNDVANNNNTQDESK